jgi:trans-aconitate methyltransferase
MNSGFDGEQYRRASHHQREWGAKLIAELQLQGAENILDLGCGDGALTDQLASLAPQGRVVGIDASPSMIDAARRHRRPNLTFELLDISQLAFEAEFDLVFSNATLHWVLDHRNLLQRVFKSLKKNGMARFNFAGEGNCSNFNRVVQEVMRQPRYARYFADFVWPWHMPKVDDYRLLVSQFPFREVRVWGENADRLFPDAAAMIRWIDQPSLVPFMPRIEDADRAGFRAEVIEGMLRVTRQSDGRRFETFRRINVFARK